MPLISGTALLQENLSSGLFTYSICDWEEVNLQCADALPRDSERLRTIALCGGVAYSIIPRSLLSSSRIVYISMRNNVERPGTTSPCGRNGYGACSH